MTVPSILTAGLCMQKTLEKLFVRFDGHETHVVGFLCRVFAHMVIVGGKIVFFKTNIFEILVGIILKLYNSQI